jgi:hypothetical protein
LEAHDRGAGDRPRAGSGGSERDPAQRDRRRRERTRDTARSAAAAGASGDAAQRSREEHRDEQQRCGFEQRGGRGRERRVGTSGRQKRAGNPGRAPERRGPRATSDFDGKPSDDVLVATSPPGG